MSLISKTYRKNYRVCLAGFALAGWLASPGMAMRPSPSKTAPVPVTLQESAPEETPSQPETRKATDQERNSVIRSIETQLNAFRDDDYEKAFRYQSSGLRRNFRSLGEFRQMMRQGYPQFANYKAVSFGAAQAIENGKRIRIEVALTGRDGVHVKATYLMVMEESEYRVESVFGGRPSRAEPRDVA